MSDELAASMWNYIWQEITLKFTCPETDFDLTTVSLALDWLKRYIEKAEEPRHEFGAQDAHKVLSVIQKRYLETVGYRSSLDRDKKERTDLPASAYRELSRSTAFDSLSVLQSLRKLFYADELSRCKVCGDHPSDFCHHANTSYIAAWKWHLRNLCELTSPLEMVRYFKQTIGIDLSGRGEHER